jgi:hypothetical protein
MLFRATRGNMLFNQAPADEHIMDPLSTEMVSFCFSINKSASCFVQNQNVCTYLLIPLIIAG